MPYNNQLTNIANDDSFLLYGKWKIFIMHVGREKSLIASESISTLNINTQLPFKVCRK